MTITAQDIAARVNGLLIDSNSRPTETTVDEMILEQSARVRGYCVSKGLEWPLTGDPALVARSVTIRLVVSRVIEARARNTTGLSTSAWTEAQTTLDLIAQAPERLGAEQGGRASTMAGVGDSGCGCGRYTSTLARLIADDSI